MGGWGLTSDILSLVNGGTDLCKKMIAPQSVRCMVSRKYTGTHYGPLTKLTPISTFMSRVNDLVMPSG